MIALLFFVLGLHVFVRTDAGPLCLKCNYAITPGECEQVVRCSDHEECYMQQYVSPGGHVLYDLGCQRKSACQTWQPIVGKRAAGETKQKRKQNQNDYVDGRTVFCEACCNSGDACNRGGFCGTKVPDLRGDHLCFNCDQQFGVDGCDRFKLCAQDRFCIIEQTQSHTSNRVFYKTGCAKSLNCTTQSMAYATRCVSCCSGNFCNNKCVKATLPTTPPTTSTSTTTTTTQSLTAPKIVTISMNPRHIQSGDRVSLTCIATGDPLPKVVWEMLASPGHVPTNVHGDNQFPARLVIDGFDPKVNAIGYRCYAANSLGVTNKTVSIP